MVNEGREGKNSQGREDWTTVLSEASFKLIRLPVQCKQSCLDGLHTDMQKLQNDLESSECNLHQTFPGGESITAI